jgi:dihydrofolate reductase
VSATYTWDIFCTLDGFGSYDEHGDWGGYWGKQQPEWLEHRLMQYSSGALRMVFGAKTMRVFMSMIGSRTPAEDAADPINTHIKNAPTTVVSSTLTEPLGWPAATVVSGDAAEVVRGLKDESDVPLRSHGSLSLNRALMAAGLVDALQVTIFPVISGQTGTDAIFQGAADFDLELIGSTTFDGGIQELIYRPTLH